jgi:hypothetical protein
VQYADYTLLQRELLGDEADTESFIARQLNYWRDAWSGLPDQPYLPVDKARPGMASCRGESVQLRIDVVLHRKLAC